MKLAVLAITKGGHQLADKLSPLLKAEVIEPADGIAKTMAAVWHSYDGFIMIMATGIVVRTIAPLLEDKRHDPCVVVVDETGKFAISLLSGHLGGGNNLAQKTADILAAQAVITTASDCLGLTPLDLWIRDNRLFLDQGDLTSLSSKLVNEGKLKIYSDQPLANLPDDFSQVDQIDEADLLLTNRLCRLLPQQALLRPKNLVAGIGCNRGTSKQQIAAMVIKTCQEHKLSLLSIRNIASIDIKNDEEGLLEYATDNGLVIDFYDKGQLNSVADVGISQTVLNVTGAKGVCEPAALLSANTKNLLVRKTKCKEVTIAIAETPITLKENYTWSAPARATQDT